jgi:hypothetical protein
MSLVTSAFLLKAVSSEKSGLESSKLSYGRGSSHRIEVVLGLADAPKAVAAAMPSFDSLVAEVLDDIPG